MTVAHSLMVDELAGWKAVLGRRCREAEVALKGLLSERRHITEQLHTAARSDTWLHGLGQTCSSVYPQSALLVSHCPSWYFALL